MTKMKPTGFVVWDKDYYEWSYFKTEKSLKTYLQGFYGQSVTRYDAWNSDERFNIGIIFPDNSIEYVRYTIEVSVDISRTFKVMEDE